MAKRVSTFLKANRKCNFVDIDFHEFVEMIDEGYNNTEIADELGVSTEQVQKLRREINSN